MIGNPGNNRKAVGSGIDRDRAALRREGVIHPFDIGGEESNASHRLVVSDRIGLHGAVDPVPEQALVAGVGSLEADPAFPDRVARVVGKEELTGAGVLPLRVHQLGVASHPETTGEKSETESRSLSSRT